MFLVLLDMILLLIIIQFAYIKIAFEMYGQYHLPRGKNPALSCLIGFVSMDRAKQQNYSTSTTVQVIVHLAAVSCTPPS